MSLSQLLQSVDFGAVWQTVSEAVADPTSNLVVALMLLGFVGVTLLILVLSILMLLAGSAGDEDEDEDEEGSQEQADETADDVAAASAPDSTVAPAQPVTAEGGSAVVEPSSRARRLAMTLGALLIPLLVVGSLIGGYVITAQDRYCISCHAAQSGAVSTTAEGTGADGQAATPLHAGVRCVACHESSQLTGVLGNSLDRARHLSAFAMGVRAGADATVDPARCLECHDSIASRTTIDLKRGIKMSHREPLAAGSDCAECHPDAGHRPAAKGLGMSACLRCHDDKSAKASCITCHTGEPSQASLTKRTFASAQIISKGDCSGCHGQSTCDSCHGLRMPHDIKFLSYDHARYAGFDKRVLCWRCHVEGDCGRCHQTSSQSYWGHTSGTSWKKLHQTITPPGVIAGCGCHGRSPYVKSGQDYCLACHPPGIRNRVKQ